MFSTIQQHEALSKMFNIINEGLFNSELPEVFLNFSRKRKNNYGYFSPEKWGLNGKKYHEISLNPASAACINSNETIQTLAHEMCHLWQFEKGNPSRKAYHNKEWALKMESIGLIPSSTGKPGGRKTGQNILDYIEEGGELFLLLPKIKELPLKSIIHEEAVKENKKRNKIKYTCESCGSNVWGKAGLLISCNECDTDFKEVEK